MIIWRINYRVRAYVGDSKGAVFERQLDVFAPTMARALQAAKAHAEATKEFAVEGLHIVVRHDDFVATSIVQHARADIVG